MRDNQTHSERRSIYGILLKQTAKMLGVSLSTLDNLRQERKIGYYQKYPGCKVQFTQAHIDKYLKRVEREDREPKIRRK